ncbi:MAG TPA: response regulator transcription factor [Candidatus Limiplasma pullistercoris]|nr:response regulator transcription factor [Candidatus Limiplasma pullistercoris]
MIYVVEDDPGIRELECYALKQAGFEARGFEEGEAFLEAVRVQLPKLVLLDVMLPGEDGNRLLARLRQDPRTRRLPVIMVTARGEEMDKVQGLDSGADDYIVKPFGVMELLSRVRAVIRRAGDEQSPQTELAVGDLRMDVARHRVFVKGRDVTLTHMEFELLRYLLINRGIALTRERLLDAVWGVDYPGDTRTVDVHMRTLRVKLGEASRCLQTVRGVGYRLEDADAEENL